MKILYLMLVLVFEFENWDTDFESKHYKQR